MPQTLKLGLEQLELQLVAQTRMVAVAVEAVAAALVAG
jgi:hypothetical protein